MRPPLAPAASLEFHSHHACCLYNLWVGHVCVHYYAVAFADSSRLGLCMGLAMVAAMRGALAVSIRSAAVMCLLGAPPILSVPY